MQHNFRYRQNKISVGLIAFFAMSLLFLELPREAKAQAAPDVLFGVDEYNFLSALSTPTTGSWSDTRTNPNDTRQGITIHSGTVSTSSVTINASAEAVGYFTGIYQGFTSSASHLLTVYVKGSPTVTITTESSGSVSVTPDGGASADLAKTSAHDISQSGYGSDSDSNSHQVHLNLGCSSSSSTDKDGTQSFSGTSYSIPTGFNGVNVGGVTVGVDHYEVDPYDSFDITSEVSTTVTVEIGSDTPVATVQGPKVGGVVVANPAVGDSVTVTNKSYDPDNQTGTTALEGICSSAWVLTKPDATQTTGSSNSSFSFTPATPGQYELQLTVTDNEGATAQTSLTIVVDPRDPRAGCSGPIDPQCSKISCADDGAYDAQISPISGNSVVSGYDPIETRGYPLSNNVHINSQSRYPRTTPFGNAAFTYGMEVRLISVSGTNHWILYGADGVELDFGATSGSPSNPAGVYCTFNDTGTGYTVTAAGPPEQIFKAGNFSYEFNASGKLYRVTDPSGNIQEVTYDGSGYPTQVEDLDSGRVLEFEYDTPGLIARAIEGSGVAVTHYTYSSGKMTEIRLEDQTTAVIRELDITYNGDGLVSQIKQDNDTNSIVNFTYQNIGNGVYVANYSHASGSSGYNYLEVPQSGMKYRTSRTNAQSGKIYYDINSSYQLKKITLPTKYGAGSGAVYSYNYDSNNNVTRVQDGATTIDYTYNSLGLVTAITNNVGGTWAFTYSGVDLLTVADAINTLLTLAYTDGSNPHSPTTITDANSKVWTWAYNAYGQPTSFTPPTGSPRSATSWTYENTGASPAYGYLKTITNGAGDVTDFTSYSALGDLLEMVTNPASGVTNATQYEYDAARRLTKITHPDSTTQEFAYIGKDLDSFLDEAGSLFSYDWCAVCGQITGASFPLSKSLSWARNADHQVTGFTDARTKSTAYTYGSAGELKKATYPDTSETEYKYDNYGRFNKVITPRAKTITYVYDTAGRVYQQTFSPSQTTNAVTYNADDTIATSSNDGGSATYTYTATKKLASVTHTLTGVTNTQKLEYTYNNDDSLATMKWKDGTTTVVTWTYSYDGAGRISQITNSYGESVQYAYDGEGKITTQTNGNGTSTVYTYNEDRDWPTRIDHKLSSTSFARYDLTYDSGSNTVGNLTGVTELSGDTMTYTYDALYRLTGETRTGSNSYTTSYTYDLAGNMTQVNGSTFATYDDANTLSTVAGGSRSKDASGNLTAISGTGITTQSYTWESREKMATQVLGSTTYTYAYDWTGKRISRASSGGSKYWYLYNGDQLVGEFGKATSGGSVAPSVAYTWGADGLAIERSLSTTNSLYYHFGPQGETRQLTDSTGAVANTYLYNAYGATIASTGTEYNRHRYGGKVGYFTDGPSTSVLILATHRWYNPEIRRWLSRDPIEYRGGENLYEYVGGNPVGLIDPTGLASVFNGSDQPIRYKSEEDGTDANGNKYPLPPAICLPGKTCNADGVYPVNPNKFPVKIPGNCKGVILNNGQIQIQCELPKIYDCLSGVARGDWTGGEPKSLTPSDLNEKDYGNWPNPYTGRNWPYPLFPSLVGR